MTSEIEAVRIAALTVFTSEGVDIWLDAPNSQLHNATPRQCVEAGDADKVMGLIEQLATGSFG